MQIRSLPALVALILLATLLATPGAAQPLAAPPQPTALSFFGMNTYLTGLERNGRDGDAGVATLAARGRQIGAAWAREELSWANLERNAKGRWLWEQFDRRLLVTASAGYGIVGMLLTTPRWARVADCAQRIERYAGAGVRSLDYWCPPASPQDYADYVRAVVERYDGDGNADAPGSPRVAAWQLWNEPNHWETWPGSPAEYAAILQAGYAAAKAADPSAIVAVGGLYILDGAWADGVGHQDGLRFLDAALAARPAAWGSFDALAVHPYMPDVAPEQPGLYGAITLWGRLSTARAWLDERASRFGGPARPLWVSELGWSTCSAAEADCFVGGAALAAEAPQAALALGPTAAGVYAQAPESAAAPDATETGQASLAALIGKSEQQQADYLVRAHGIALALGVQHMSWFQLEDKFDGTARNFWEEAALFRTAAQGYAPKPAAIAYSAMTTQLGGTSFVGFGALHSFAYAPTAAQAAARFHLRFRSADGYLIDLLWRNAGAERVALALEPGATLELLGRDGAPSAVEVSGGTATLTISESPSYLRQSLPQGYGLSRPEPLVLARPGDGPLPVSIGVSNTGSGSLSWSASSDAAWLRVETPSGQGYSSELRLLVSPAGLAPGSYRASVRLAGSAGTRDIPVRLVVDQNLPRLYLPLMGQAR